MDPNWWLFFYNLGQEVLGVNGSTPTGITPLLFDTPLPDPLTAQAIGQQIYPITEAEISASVTPTYYEYPSGNVLRYGADATGNLDSTQAFQSAGAVGILIHAPAGIYKVSSGITITGGGIVGDGAYLTYILTSDTGTNDVFKYTGALAGRFENFQLGLETTKSGGYGLVIGPATGEVSAMRLWQLVFNGMPNGVNFVAASLWSTLACNFYNFTGTAVNVNNTNAADSGDSVLANCLFNSSNNSAICINQVASGGLKVIGNKFNNAGYHYLLDLGNTSTSDVLLVGNSFESANGSAIQLQLQVGSNADFNNVVITGNQFLNCANQIISNEGSVFLSGVTITGNVMRITNATGVSILLDYVNNAIIDGNTLIGGGGSTTGIDIGTHNTGQINIGVNSVSGYNQDMAYTPAYGINVSPSVFQTGTLNVTTSSSTGSLFYGTATIAFANAFAIYPTLQNCSVTITNAASGGGISAYVTSVSPTQLFIAVVGTSNGGSVPVQWSVGAIA